MSIEHYSRTRQIELARSLAGRRKIYLDACFWILARDVALGVRDDAPARKLLHHLRRGVSNGQLVCPISAPMFLEMMKQRHTPTRRLGTARLIDELSLGVSMVPSHTIVATEIHAFLLRVGGNTDLYSMQELVWTKVAYVLGDLYLSLELLSPADELTLQKADFDHRWSLSLSEMLDMIGDNSPPSDRHNELSRKTNELNALHKDELRSFAQTYDIELRGIIELAGDTAADVYEHLAQKAGYELPPSSEERADTVKMCRNLLYHAFQKTETKKALRSLHIGASIHASMRWDKNRKFKPNDYYDFEHATAALSYCDAFLTEGPLHDLVTRPQVNLEAVNGCRVFSDIEPAVDHLKQILSSN